MQLPLVVVVEPGQVERIGVLVSVGHRLLEERAHLGTEPLGLRIETEVHVALS